MNPPGNPITPDGLATLRDRYDRLLGTERPKIVEVVSWAAGNGDRSENGDYIYGRKRLREIDRELARLARRMKAARVIDPACQPDRGRAFFGATVEIAEVVDRPSRNSAAASDDTRRTLVLIGDDEADADAGRIGWSSPLARALRGAAVGDVRLVHLPGGEKEWEVVAISYPG
jgi:transcription elongation factor GreB